MADSFAAIRTIQKFGDNGVSFISKFLELRLSNLFYDKFDLEHFTCNSLEEIIQLNNNKDLKGLNLKETMELAFKITNDNIVHFAEYSEIHNSLNNIARVKRYEKQGGLSEEWIVDNYSSLNLPKNLSKFLDKKKSRSRESLKKLLYPT